jgi:flagellar basal body-associated protein FliL
MLTKDSALIALSELQNLEADRVRREQQARQAKADAERQARELVQQRAREQAEREAAEQAARLHAQRMAELQREHEDRVRVQEAEARARVEHDARLRHEQLRLEAQIRMSEQRARPRWPLVVVPVLLLGVVGAAVMAWQGQQFSERVAQERAKAQELAAQQTKALAAVTAKLDALEAEQARMQQARTDLTGKMAAARGDEAAEAKLRQQLDALDADIANNDRARAEAGRGGVRPRPRPRPKTDAKPDKPRTRPVLELSGSNDPLAGIK